ncbi:RagB/SusD family nutrient uptake outer membrane protein [uncultured Proteiniphilum sp.]|uniref:RagB/SusD family nutrient uptake outer membrane protein n=1 Tax=uncultured Proteiniphilum sp. TaxID=497637 RepID=UPI002609FFBE|nr:RagB/SusD family nutrient uptake outer membrane protein [uncultured Proteiniphilum sp.]
MKRNLIIYSLLFLFSLAACNDLEQVPTNKFTDENYWTSTNKAMSVLNMAYNQMYNADFFFRTEALSDNMYQRRIHDEKIISSGQADASNARFKDEWSRCYAGIKTCHTFLENVDRVPDMDENLKNRAKAEARFIRALLFFRLTTWYGDIPLFTKDITLSESKTIERTPHADAIRFICDELEEIAGILPTNKQYTEADRGRITAGAAIALKARVYLFENDWQNTVTTCERLMGNTTYGEYGLYDNYAKLFTVEGEYSKEMILNIEYVPSLRTWADYQDFMPKSSLGGRVSKMAPTQELIDDYIMQNGKGIKESGSGYNENNPYINRDPRMDMTIVRHLSTWTLPDGNSRTIYTKPGSTTDPTGRLDIYVSNDETTSPTGYYMRKYYDRTAINGINSGMNLMMIRYADVLLMYAEAKNELGQLTENVWGVTIQALRQRAGFTDPAALDFNSAWTPADRQLIIRRERRSELALEGLRIFDIRRWRTAEVVLNQRPHGAMFENNNTEYIVLDQRTFNPERDYLWPVPQSEKDINPNLGQNPNY